LLVRNQPVYRRDAFVSGLRVAGLGVDSKPAVRILPSDVLVIWNRYGVNHHLARRYEDAGAAVIVTENGYIDFRGAKKTFAMALNHHNGAGHWPQDGESRASMIDVDVVPWRGDGTVGDILLLPQRGVGPPGVAMPRTWIQDTLARVGLLGTRRHVRVRQHPGTARPSRTLESDVESAGVCVTWASGAAIKALALGIPVVHEFPKWVGAPAGSLGLATIPHPRIGDQAAALEAVARAQWTVDEVASGAPFLRLLALHDARMERKRLRTG
jgi:hypothetical protein